MKNSNDTNIPWYRYPVVWLVVAIPVISVISSTVLIIIANLHEDGLVVDDYYKHGKAINKLLSRDLAATKAELRAKIQIDNTNRITIELNSKQQVDTSNLVLNLVHIRYPKQDQMIHLKPITAKRSSGQLKPFQAGKWYIQIGNKHWRLIGKQNLKPSSSLSLNFNPK